MNIDNYILMNKKTSEDFLLKTSSVMLNIKNASIDCTMVKTGVNSKIFDFAKDMFEKINYKINMKVIYSTDVFPEILIKNKQANIIWDLCFWQLYEKFVKYMLFLEDNDSISYQDNIIEQYRGDLIFYLANRLDEYSELSYVLAEKFMMYFLEMPVKYKLLEGLTLDYILINAQVIALFHERNHYLFKNNRAEYYKYFNVVSDIIKLAYNYEDQEVQHIYDKILKNANCNVVEEMLCDYRAVLETIDMQLDLSDFLLRVQETFKAFLFYTMVISNLDIVEKAWKGAITAYNRKNVIENDIFTDREYLMIRGRICEDLIIYSYSILLKTDSCFNVEKYVDIDFNVLRQAVRCVCSDTFLSEVVRQANLYSKNEYKKEHWDQEKADIFMRYWNP